MAELKKRDHKVLKSFASRVDRNDPGALNNLGVLYFRKGMYEEAIAQFKEAVKIDPRFDLARENLRFLFKETKMEDPDVNRWRTEVEKDPESMEAALRLGVSYQNMGRFEEAARTFGGIVEKKPDHFLARMHLGSVLKARGLYQQALEHYQYVSKDASKSAVFHTDLGEIYYNLGRTEETISELRKAIKLDAEYWRSHFLLSFAYGDVGQLQEALEESRIASRLNPTFQSSEANLALSDREEEREKYGSGGMGKEIPSLESTSFTLGSAYRERGYLAEALNEFRKALQEMPDKDRVLIEIGKVHLVDNNDDKALSTFHKALVENRENPDAYRLCGCLYHRMGSLRKAAICYLQAYRLNSTDADAMNNIGVLLYQVGLLEDAEKMFKMGLNKHLYNMELNYNFMTCILFKEEYLMAENLLQRLEAFMGKSALLYEKRALLNYKLNRMTLALFDLESALSLDRGHSDAHYLKGMISLREEDFQGAIDAIIEGSKINKRYTGMDFYIAFGDHFLTEPCKVRHSVDMEPGDELIELLEAGANRRFDKIQDLLVSGLDGCDSNDHECEDGLNGLEAFSGTEQMEDPSDSEPESECDEDKDSLDDLKLEI